MAGKYGRGDRYDQDRLNYANTVTKKPQNREEAMDYMRVKKEQRERRARETEMALKLPEPEPAAVTTTSVPETDIQTTSKPKRVNKDELDEINKKPNNSKAYLKRAGTPQKRSKR